MLFRYTKRCGNLERRRLLQEMHLTFFWSEKLYMGALSWTFSFKIRMYILKTANRNRDFWRDKMLETIYDFSCLLLMWSVWWEWVGSVFRLAFLFLFNSHLMICVLLLCKKLNFFFYPLFFLILVRFFPENLLFFLLVRVNKGHTLIF